MFFTVALTGGPCGGKSSSLEQFRTELESRGVDVYTAPEVPTIIINAGAKYPGPNSPLIFAYEKSIIDLQMQVEDSLSGNMFLQVLSTAS